MGCWLIWFLCGLEDFSFVLNDVGYICFVGIIIVIYWWEYKL